MNYDKPKKSLKIKVCFSFVKVTLYRLMSIFLPSVLNAIINRNLQEDRLSI